MYMSEDRCAVTGDVRRAHGAARAGGRPRAAMLAELRDADPDGHGFERQLEGATQAVAEKRRRFEDQLVVANQPGRCSELHEQLKRRLRRESVVHRVLLTAIVPDQQRHGGSAGNKRQPLGTEQLGGTVQGRDYRSRGMREC